MERLLADAEAFSGVHYDIDNLGDVYSAIHVIQGELGLTGVAAGEAKTTLTGSMGAVKASWENVMAALTTGEGLEEALDNFSESFGNFSTNVISMLAALAPQLPDLIMGLADTIIANAPTFIESGVELIAKLAVGLITSIPSLIAKLPEIFSAVKSAFAGVDWAQLGKDIIQGIINGITGMASRLWQKMKDVVRGALGAGQEEAETGSPSRLFADELGHWIPPGIAMGAEQNMAPLNRAMAGIMDTTLADMQRATAAPTQSASQGASLERSMAALASRPVQVGVVLDANARKLLRVVRTENRSETLRTQYNGLSGAMA